MSATIEFFPVGNGDMTLITLESGKKILVDINIRKEGEVDEWVDVAELLHERLDRDGEERLFVDAFLLSHPDQDHCRGLLDHFHLGKPSDWVKKDNKILIREMWSSPIVFRRSKDVEGGLCKDAEAWWDEARRRVKVFRDAKTTAALKDGDRIQILGEDKKGKTDGLEAILVKTGNDITKICAKIDGTFAGHLIGPRLVTDKEAETLTGKNHSSVIIRFGIDGDGTKNAGLFLSGGDAEVDNWERVWARYKDKTDKLTYNIMQTPHHCSWHVLSHDSWSDKKDDAKVSKDARSALSQTQNGAFIVASCKAIVADEPDPPSVGAEREYKAITTSAKGEFLCTADECDDGVLLFTIGAKGPTRDNGDGGQKLGGASGVKPRMTDKQGGGRYA